MCSPSIFCHSRGPNKLHVYEPHQKLRQGVHVPKTGLSPPPLRHPHPHPHPKHPPSNSSLTVPNSASVVDYSNPIVRPFSVYLRLLIRFLFRITWCPSVEKVLSSWLSACAVLLDEDNGQVLAVSGLDNGQVMYVTREAIGQALSLEEIL